MFCLGYDADTQFFAHARRRVMGVLVLLMSAVSVLGQTGSGQTGVGQTGPGQLVSRKNVPARYVTRFETQTRVEYQPEVRVAVKTVRRIQWNPFRPGPDFQKRFVPTVHWAPTVVREQLPVTDRLALGNAPRISAVRETSTSGSRQKTTEEIANLPVTNDGWRARESPRLAAQNARQPSGVKSIDRVPTRNFQTRSIVNSNSPQFGGVQLLDEVAPRIGMQFRELR